MTISITQIFLTLIPFAVYLSIISLIKDSLSGYNQTTTIDFNTIGEFTTLKITEVALRVLFQSMIPLFLISIGKPFLLATIPVLKIGNYTIDFDKLFPDEIILAFSLLTAFATFSLLRHYWTLVRSKIRELLTARPNNSNPTA
jgi:hypothetical protein